MTDWIAEAKVELADPDSTLWKCNVIEGLLAEIDRLTLRNASLVEVLRDKPCPYDGRYTIGECQQCGCSEGLFVAKRDLTQ
jgi:hypothetical protein